MRYILTHTGQSPLLLLRLVLAAAGGRSRSALARFCGLSRERVAGLLADPAIARLKGSMNGLRLDDQGRFRTCLRVPLAAMIERELDGPRVRKHWLLWLFHCFVVIGCDPVDRLGDLLFHKFQRAVPQRPVRQTCFADGPAGPAIQPSLMPPSRGEAGRQARHERYLQERVLGDVARELLSLGRTSLFCADRAASHSAPTVYSLAEAAPVAPSAGACMGRVEENPVYRPLLRKASGC